MAIDQGFLLGDGVFDGSHPLHDAAMDGVSCTACHQGVASFKDIRISPMDFDGDGVTTNGISVPIAALHARLEDAIELYATEIVQAPVVYSSHAYPYFFADTNATLLGNIVTWLDGNATSLDNLWTFANALNTTLNTSVA